IYGQDVEQGLMDLGRHERQILFRDADVKNDLENLFGIDRQVEEGLIYPYIKARIMRQVIKRAIIVGKALEQFLGEDSPGGKGLIGNYHNLLGGLGKLRASLAHKEAYYSAPEDLIFCISLYQPGDVDHW
ncbi:MAG: hypothetical protein HQK58_16935, partial [Deltaproteobacteria bacterium]|nr:hypothetical protein [Deltaproteobacteria bacterium]